MRCKLALVAMALGCQPKPSPPILSNKLPPAAIATPTCKEAGVILRAHVNDDTKAGPAKEAVITGACEADRWSTEIVTCVASSPQPQNCLAGLTDEIHASYDAKLKAWADQYGEDLDNGDVPAAPEVACSDAIGDVALYAPVVTLTGEDRDFVVRMRRAALAEQCEAGWDEAVKSCLQAAKQAAEVASCAASLEPAQATLLADRLAKIDAVMTKTIAARAKVPDCKKLVGLHYGDPAWKTKLDAVKGADRKRVIDESRKKMVDACTAETWSPSLRACVSVGGDADCFAGVPYAWDFPALGVFAPTGIAECDAFVAQIQSYAKCDKLPREQRDSIQQAIAQSMAALPQMAADPAQKQQMQESCKAGLDAMKQALTALGC